MFLWIVDNVTGNLVTGTVLPYLWAGLKSFTAHSAGWFGLLTFGLLAFLIISIWAENTQFGQKLLAPRIAKPAKPAPMTLEEREEIQQLRTFWNLYFGFAVERCTSVFSTLLAELEMNDDPCGCRKPRPQRPVLSPGRKRNSPCLYTRQHNHGYGDKASVAFRLRSVDA